MTTFEERITIHQEDSRRMLRELGLATHRNGYKQLILLVSCYAPSETQSLTKELYPYVADRFGYGSWKPVERAVRYTILEAWKRRNSEVWDRYFPGMKKAPSNKQFIATLAEWRKNSPPENGRGYRLPRGCVRVA